jgi:hypothetical protein
VLRAADRIDYGVANADWSAEVGHRSRGGDGTQEMNGGGDCARGGHGQDHDDRRAQLG